MCWGQLVVSVYLGQLYTCRDGIYGIRGMALFTGRFYSKRRLWAGFRSMNLAENPVRALAWVGYSQNTFSAGFINLNPAPEGSLSLIPHLVARWTKTILQLLNLCFYWWCFIGRDGREVMFTNLVCLWYCGDSTTTCENDNITTAYPRHLGHCEFTEGLWSIIMLTSYQMSDYTLTPMIRGMISSSNIM